MEFFPLREMMRLSLLNMVFPQFIIYNTDDLTACSFSFFSFSLLAYLINMLRETNCSSNGLFWCTLLAPTSEAAYRAVLTPPRPMLVSQGSQSFDRLPLCIAWYQKLSYKAHVKQVHGIPRVNSCRHFNQIVFKGSRM